MDGDLEYAIPHLLDLIKILSSLILINNGESQLLSNYRDYYQAELKIQ
jgi:hypothetical protein